MELFASLIYFFTVSILGISVFYCAKWQQRGLNLSLNCVLHRIKNARLLFLAWVWTLFKGAAIFCLITVVLLFYPFFIAAITHHKHTVCSHIFNKRPTELSLFCQFKCKRRSLPHNASVNDFTQLCILLLHPGNSQQSDHLDFNSIFLNLALQVFTHVCWLLCKRCPDRCSCRSDR